MCVYSCAILCYLFLFFVAFLASIALIFRCVRACICVRETERQKQKERGRERDRERETERETDREAKTARATEGACVCGPASDWWCNPHAFFFFFFFLTGVEGRPTTPGGPVLQMTKNQLMALTPNQLAQVLARTQSFHCPDISLFTHPMAACCYLAVLTWLF